MTYAHDFNADRNLEKDEVKRLLLQNLPTTLKHLLPKGVVDNGKFYVGNIKGNPGRSLVVEIGGRKAGLWRDFATSDGGDILHLWAAVHGLDIEHNFSAVLSSAQEWLGIRTSAVQTTTNAKLECGTLECEEAEWNESECNKPKHSKPERNKPDLGPSTGKWTYTTENYKPITIIYRFDPSDGDKEFRPHDVKTGLCKAPEGLRPLYNLPGIKVAEKVVLVEGEKAAQALIDIGICATTAMFGSSAPTDKTDWFPLVGKHVLIWPDNDEPGQKYAQAVIEKLKQIEVDSVSMVSIPYGKPTKWDAADALKEGMNISTLLKRKTLVFRNFIPMEESGKARLKSTTTAEDLIGPRILTPNGIVLFGGVPKVGKSDLILNWLAHMSAGVPFLGMTPSRPLKILYLQAELKYDYICERIQQLQIDKSLLPLVDKNLVYTYDANITLDDDGFNIVRRSIMRHFANNDVDIITMDPLRNFFDSRKGTVSENDNNAMIDFLNRVRALCNSINPDAGIIFVHHLRKLSASDLKGAQFQTLSGAGSLRCFYDTGILMWQPDENKQEYQLVYELRYGTKPSNKWIAKVDGRWTETDRDSEPMTGTTFETKAAKECRMKRDQILDLICSEARENRLYTLTSFAQKWEYRDGLGGAHAIRNRLDVLTTQGHIKFIRTGVARSKNGHLCVDGMEIPTDETKTDPLTGKVSKVYKKISATHGKSSDGEVVEIENPTEWANFEDLKWPRN